jgi:hypothetical protein
MNPIEKNEPLDRALRAWKVDAALPPRFQEAVWRRIAQAEILPATSWVRRFWPAIEAALRRPALAVSYVVVLLMAGLSIGIAQARKESARVDAGLGARYVQSIDPYQTPRH